MVQLSGLAAHKKPCIWAWRPPKSLAFGPGGPQKASHLGLAAPTRFSFELWLNFKSIFLACSNIFSARHFLAQLGLQFYGQTFILNRSFHNPAWR